MFKLLTGLLTLALSAVALPVEITDGTVRLVSSAALGVVAPRQVAAPAGFNM
jgi:hypothetical protein